MFPSSSCKLLCMINNCNIDKKTIAKYILLIIITIASIVFLFHFSKKSNQVQIHEFYISIDASNPELLDSLYLSFEYPDSLKKSLCLNVVPIINGNVISNGKSKKYFLKNGYIADSISARLRIDVGMLADGQPSKGLEPNIEKGEMYIVQVGTIVDSIRKSYVEYFFFKDFNYPDKLPLFDTLSYQKYNPSFWSMYNIQKRCIAFNLTPVSLRFLPNEKIQLNINFNSSVNPLSVTIEPDICKFKEFKFSGGEFVEKLTSNSLSAIVEMMPYEGIQVTRNMFIGLLIPLLISLCLFWIRRIILIYKNGLK